MFQEKQNTPKVPIETNKDHLLEAHKPRKKSTRHIVILTLSFAVMTITCLSYALTTVKYGAEGLQQVHDELYASLTRSECMKYQNYDVNLSAKQIIQQLCKEKENEFIREEQILANEESESKYFLQHSLDYGSSDLRVTCSIDSDCMLVPIESVCGGFNAIRRDNTDIEKFNAIEKNLFEDYIFDCMVPPQIDEYHPVCRKSVCSSNPNTNTI